MPSDVALPPIWMLAYGMSLLALGMFAGTKIKAVGALQTIRWARISHEPTPSLPITWKARGTKPQIR